jgi:hypothetical protein
MRGRQFHFVGNLSDVHLQSTHASENSHAPPFGGNRPLLLVLAIFAFGSNYAETSSCKHVAIQPGAQQSAGSCDPHRARISLLHSLSRFPAILCAAFQQSPRSRVLDSLSRNAYGMYLVHYVFVVWLQYALLNAHLFAFTKAAIVFGVTLVLSWATSAALRRLLLLGLQRGAIAKGPMERA